MSQIHVACPSPLFPCKVGGAEARHSIRICSLLQILLEAGCATYGAGVLYVPFEQRGYARQLQTSL